MNFISHYVLDSLYLGRHTQIHLFDSLHSYGSGQARLGMSKIIPNIESEICQEATKLIFCIWVDRHYRSRTVVAIGWKIIQGLEDFEHDHFRGFWLESFCINFFWLNEIDLFSSNCEDSTKFILAFHTKTAGKFSLIKDRLANKIIYQ